MLLKEKISKITKCDTHTKIGVSSDEKYDCYLSTTSGAESNLPDELKRTEIQIIDKKERPKNACPVDAISYGVRK